MPEQTRIEINVVNVRGNERRSWRKRTRVTKAIRIDALNDFQRGELLELLMSMAVSCAKRLPEEKQ